MENNLINKQAETSKVYIDFNELFDVILATGKIFAAIVFSAFLFYCIAYFVPDLRQILPDFYVIVDSILKQFNIISVFVRKFSWLV